MLQSAQSTTAANAFFHAELSRLGPQRPPAAWSHADAEAYCRRWARQSYENFTVVSWLLPRHVRQDFYNVYAYCRWADNLADEVADRQHSLELLAWWQQQLALCYSGRPSHPVLVALQTTIQRHHIPITPFADLLSAFRQDQTVTRYDSDTQLLDYCTRSANPVGRILLHLAGAAEETQLELSDHICSGLQLANFCQDMSRDAAIDRIYAPRSRWQAHGVTEEMLLLRQPTSGLQNLLAAWVADTRVMFEAGRPLVDRVPRWLATDIDLFIRGGVAVLDAIEQQRFDVWTKRPKISKLQKLCLLASSLTRRLRSAGGQQRGGHA